MNTHKTRLAVLLASLLAMVGGLGTAAAATNQIISIDAKPTLDQLEIRFKGRRLLVYAFAASQFKPYVRELYTLRGENVLRDAPPDHLHHHGLMYGVRVNGIDFWDERGAPGIQKHIELPVQIATAPPQGLPEAHFTELIHWLAPTNRTAAPSLNAALLVEQRTLTVTVDEQNQEVALRWDSQFQVGPTAGKVTLHGPNYDGLGLRLPQSFDHVARFQNDAGKPYTGQNTQDVIPARWTSVSGAMGEHEVMLALFGRKDNPRGDSNFFTMLDHFAYLSATEGLDQQPLEYKAGSKFSLSYLLTVYSEYKSPSFIRQRCDLWEKERR